jgi:hypothetical protein
LTQRKVLPCGLPDKERLPEVIMALTKEFGQYGYRMIAGMLNNSGWHVKHTRRSRGLRANHCRAVVARIWRPDRLKVPQSTPRRAGFGRMMARASGFCQTAPPTFDPIISVRTEPMTGGFIAG